MGTGYFQRDMLKDTLNGKINFDRLPRCIDLHVQHFSDLPGKLRPDSENALFRKILDGLITKHERYGEDRMSISAIRESAYFTNGKSEAEQKKFWEFVDTDYTLEEAKKADLIDQEDVDGFLKTYFRQ